PSAAWVGGLRAALGLAGADGAGAQRAGAAVSGRVRAVRQLSGDLPRPQPPRAGGAGGAVRRSVLRPVHLWLADRAVRRLFQRRDGVVVGGVPDLCRARGAGGVSVVAPGREALPLAPPCSAGADARRRRSRWRLSRGRQARDARPVAARAAVASEAWWRARSGRKIKGAASA